MTAQKWHEKPPRNPWEDLQQHKAQHGGHSLLEFVSLNQCMNAANLCAVSTSFGTSAHGR